MPDETAIVVDDVNVHPASGHISITVHSVTTKDNASWDGPKKTWGCDAAMFQSMFNSDIEQLKAWIKTNHIGFNGAHVDLVDKLHSMKGQTL